MIDLELLVPVGRSAPSVARQALEPARSLLMPDQMNEATVLVSELVTDAVRRADPDPDERIRVRMNVRLHEIRVEVGQSVPQTSSLERRGPLDAEATREMP